MSEKVVSLSELCHFTEKQLEATRTADNYDYVLYGGSAGGGKSYWLRWYAVRTLIKWGKEYNLKGIHGALFSEDYPTLKDRQISKMDIEFPRWLGEIKDTKTDGLGFHIKPEYGGHVLMLRNLDDPSKYLSSEFAIIAVEELTTNNEEKFHQLRSRLRWTGVPHPKFVGATNPGNIGHAWVKRRWIDKDFPQEELYIADRFAYIPVLPTDNPHLADSYINTLKSLPEKKRKAYLEGNWDVFDGQFFTEWDRTQHVIEPFTIPETWTRIRCIDPSGRAGTTACYFLAIDSDGTVYVTHEHYKSGLDSDEHARLIAGMSWLDEYNTRPIPFSFTVIDSSAFSKLGLPETTAEIYERCGVTGLIPASKDRVVGWDIFHQFLRWDEKTKPKLRIFSNCVNLIRTIPHAIHDERKPEDISNKYDGAEHNDGLDALRYGLQTLREHKAPRPLNPIEIKIREMENANKFNYSYKR